MKLVCTSIVVLTNLILVSGILNGEGHVCGRAQGNSISAEAKIVGGYDVGYHKYGWYAALEIDNIIACGGALVASKAVVSAAHCYKEYINGTGKSKAKPLEDIYHVVLGIYNRCEKERTQKTIKVAKVYVHEKYKSNIPYYDISVLMLKESASTYPPICLPKGVVKTRPKEGSVPGLGTLKYHGSTPCTLQEARLLIYSDWECKKMINRTGNDGNKIFRAFCAGYLQGGIDTCQGDSGGPFQVIDDYGNYILLGVVSFGFHCANPGLLGMYTDVSQYVDWIEKKVGFRATIEDANATSTSTTTTTSSDDETTSSVKSTTEAQEVHVIHSYNRPVNIFIMKNAEEKKVKTDNRKRKIPTRRSRRKAHKKTKNNKNCHKHNTKKHNHQ